MSPERPLLRLAVAEYRKQGLGALLRTLRRQLWRREKFGIYAADVKSIIASGGTVPELEIKTATSDDLQRWRKDDRLWAIELWWNQLYAVKQAYLGYLDGDPVHISWVFYPTDRNKYFPLEPAEAMIGPCLTYPWARGRGIYPAAIRRITSELAAQGINRVYMVVEENNVASIKGVMKAGLEHTGDVIITGLAGKTRTRLHGAIR